MGMKSLYRGGGTWCTLMNYEPSDVSLVDASSFGLNLGEEGSRMLYSSGKVEVPLFMLPMGFPKGFSLEFLL